MKVFNDLSGAAKGELKIRVLNDPVGNAMTYC
jgi:hypothetical protein